MEPVTVLLPVYNSREFLREAIDSVLSQDYTDFKLLILDDLSEDSTPEIIESYSDPRIEFRRNPEHCGLFGSLNRGFNVAESRWVKLWAHDDRMLPGALARFMECAEKHPEAAMIYSAFHRIDSAGKRGKAKLYTVQHARAPEVAYPDVSALLFLVFGSLSGNISTAMLRRDVWRESGGFVETFRQSPEFDMWVRVSAKRPIAFIREAVIEVRAHARQLSRSAGSFVENIEEEHLILSQLVARLERFISPSEMRRFWAFCRGSQYIHLILRSLIRGDWGRARRAWRSMGVYGPRLFQAVLWLLSLDGCRHLRAACQALYFDRRIGRLPGGKEPA